MFSNLSFPFYNFNRPPVTEQGRIQGYPSCVNVGAGSDGEGHWGIWAGAVISKRSKTPKKQNEDRPTDGRMDGRTDRRRDGRTDGRTDRRTSGRTCGRTDGRTGGRVDR